MDQPLGEDALDFLDAVPGAKQLVRTMLSGVVDHQDAHINSFQVKNHGNREFSYFLGKKGVGAIPNDQRLPSNIVDMLIYHKIAEQTRVPNQMQGWYGFTDAAKAWYDCYGRTTPDEVRKRIGRFLQPNIHEYREFALEGVAQAIGVPSDRVKDEANHLRAAGLIELHQGTGIDYVRLSQPTGVLWAAGGFPPISTLLSAQQAPLPTPAPRPARPTGPPQGGDIRDVFICHASEDKDAVARPLAEALSGGGLRVWFDEYELRIGDSLRRKIAAGLRNSRYGVVILSDSFFAKEWPQQELDGLVAKTTSGGGAILPIWHKISKAEVLVYSPPLADKVARSTSASTVQEIADEIVQVVSATKDDNS